MAHDLPVTGMGFASPQSAKSLGEHYMKYRKYHKHGLIVCVCVCNFFLNFLGMKAMITTCSADRKFCVMKIGGTRNLQFLNNLI